MEFDRRMGGHYNPLDKKNIEKIARLKILGKW